jgi:hypothetical protein
MTQYRGARHWVRPSAAVLNTIDKDYEKH